MNKIKTYINGFDVCLEGGIPAGHIALVVGNAGTMKSSVVFYMLYKLAKNEGKKGLYLTLEQGKDSITKQMECLGLDLSCVNGDLEVIDIGDIRKKTLLGDSFGMELEWPSITDEILNIVRNFEGCELIALDSLDALYSLTTIENPRNKLYYFFEELRKTNHTTLLISEMLTGKGSFSRFGVEEFLADGIIHLKIEENGHSVNRLISIVKMRNINHKMGYLPLIFENNEFRVLDKEDLEL